MDNMTMHPMTWSQGKQLRALCSAAVNQDKTIAGTEGLVYGAMQLCLTQI